jgi:hypothetical protein
MALLADVAHPVRLAGLVAPRCQAKCNPTVREQLKRAGSSTAEQKVKSVTRATSPAPGLASPCCLDDGVHRSRLPRSAPPAIRATTTPSHSVSAAKSYTRYSTLRPSVTVAREGGPAAKRTEICPTVSVIRSAAALTPQPRWASYDRRSSRAGAACESRLATSASAAFSIRRRGRHCERCVRSTLCPASSCHPQRSILRAHSQGANEPSFSSPPVPRDGILDPVDMSRQRVYRNPPPSCLKSGRLGDCSLHLGVAGREWPAAFHAATQRPTRDRPAAVLKADRDRHAVGKPHGTGAMQERLERGSLQPEVGWAHGPLHRLVGSRNASSAPDRVRLDAAATTAEAALGADLLVAGRGAAVTGAEEDDVTEDRQGGCTMLHRCLSPLVQAA